MKAAIIGLACLIIGLVIGGNVSNLSGFSSEPKKALSVEQWRKVIEAVNQNTIPLKQVEQAYAVEIVSDRISDVPVFRIKSKANDAQKGAVFIHLHGGGYVYYGGEAAVVEAAVIAAYSGIEVISIDYRMPPDHPHPAAIQDVEAVYRSLLKTYNPEQIGLGGTSAGGGLALAAVHQFKNKNLHPPGALFLGSPWADLTKTGDTRSTLDGLDKVLLSYEIPTKGAADLKGAAELYANGTALTDPLLSPIYGEFDNFPPAYLVSGTRDLFLSDTIRTDRKLKEAGVKTSLNVFEGLSHAEYLARKNTPEFKKVYTELGAFLNEHLSQ